MTGREAHLQELKAIKSRDAYFEGIRQIFDQMKDDFPLHQSLWMPSCDLQDAIMALEQGYRRVALVGNLKEKS